MNAFALRFASSIEQPAALVRTIQSGFLCGALALAAVVSLPGISLADEGGVSFWVPGFFGSLAATPQQPGWSLADVYYHTSVSGRRRLLRWARIPIGNVPGQSDHGAV